NAPGPETAVLLPLDPDASAERLRARLCAGGARDLAVVVSDTFGRPWREGLVDVALGSSGIAPVDDQRGGRDRSGRELVVTTPATVDQLAAAAGLLMRKDAGLPAVWIEGMPVAGDGAIRDILRTPENDLFR
ncbi:MAG: coenzyme F420-0:L-glutamate ligase, partial [Myxococcota bacterium]